MRDIYREFISPVHNHEDNSATLSATAIWARFSRREQPKHVRGGHGPHGCEIEYKVKFYLPYSLWNHVSYSIKIQSNFSERHCNEFLFYM